MEIQHRISAARNESVVGREISVLIEGYDEQKRQYHARSEWDAPQIDNQVYIPSEYMDDQILGEIVRVKVTAAKPYDLIAELIEEETDAAAPELTAVGGSH
jgi:ribosomal protein S12 methylthiotransferase